jgi:hypothetical protein
MLTTQINNLNLLGAIMANKGAGRPMGSPNRATADARQAIGSFVDGNAHRLTQWLDKVADGVQDDEGNFLAIKAIEKLVNRKLPVVQPKFEFVPEAAPEKSEAPRSEPYRKVTPNRQVAAPRSSGSSGSAPGDFPRRGSKNKSQKTKYNKFKSSGGGGGNSGGNSGGGRPSRD